MNNTDLKNDVIFTWTVLPAKKSLFKTIFFLVIFMVIIGLIHLAFQSPFFTILAGIILIGSFLQFFIPTTYEITEDKIRVKRLFNVAEKELSHYRRLIVDKNGIFLSPFAEPNRLDPYRGVYLLIEENKEEVIDFVKTRLKSN